MKLLINQFGIHHQKLIRAKIVSFLIAISLLATSCNTLLDTNTLSATDTSNTTHIITITPQISDSPKSLSQEYGGKVLAFEEGEFALISLNLDSTDSISTQLLSKLTLTNGEVEENTNAFSTSSLAGIDIASSDVWSGGSSDVWSGGSSDVWSGGSSDVWSGGEFSWMPENTQTWQQINLDHGHQVAKNLGNQIIVAVIDTGVDYTHPALSEAVMQGWDFYDNDNDPFDEGTLLEDLGTGHGTHIAGIIRQVAPRATILPIRILGPDGTGSIADLATAILWAEEQGADIINLSLGSTSYSSAVNAALSSVTRKGVMVVASAGNSSNSQVTYPASLMWFKGSQISVTSVDSNDVKSDFANYARGIELSAPGEYIFGPAPGNRKVAWSGTSMATPMVAGALALAKAEAPVMSSSYTRVLWDSVINIDSIEGNSDFSDKIGKGRLDIREYFNLITTSPK